MDLKMDDKVAEKYNGGGHKLASGARITSFEEVDLLVKDLDNVCKKYIESRVWYIYTPICFLKNR